MSVNQTILTAENNGVGIQAGSVRPSSLLVFSDDWGRHPSSCQHLVRRLLPRYQVLWVNTIGTRTPKADLETLCRVMEKMKQWLTPSRVSQSQGDTAPVESPAANGPCVLNPRMWPWFSRPFDRWLNCRLLCRQLAPRIREMPQPVTAITTLPITADVAKYLPVEKWVYYCVDDFAEWPGLDGDTLRRMDADMTRAADEIVAVSAHLQQMIRQRGREAHLLTHGVDTEFWQPKHDADPMAVRTDLALPVDKNATLLVFWGVVDRRLDTELLSRLAERLPHADIVLVGPRQNPDPEALRPDNVRSVGPRPFGQLPAIAQTADVLIMPYADLPVTRAMQPLKMKEYLATGRPVVVPNLPAVSEWRDCMDVAETAEQFVSCVQARLHHGLPDEQRAARARLAAESWHAKALDLEQRLLIGDSMEMPFKGHTL